MFGFGCCAEAGATAANPEARGASTPNQKFLFILIDFLSVGSGGNIRVVPPERAFALVAPSRAKLAAGGFGN